MAFTGKWHRCIVLDGQHCPPKLHCGDCIVFKVHRAKVSPTIGTLSGCDFTVDALNLRK